MLAVLPATLLLHACTVQPSPRHARPALSNPPSTTEPELPELLELHQHGNGRATGILSGAGEQVRFELRRAPRQTRQDEPQPLVLLVPILAGGRELMSVIAQRMVAHGFDVAFCERAGRALSAPQRGPDLDELFRRTVLHQRLLLTWLRQSADAPACTHVLGVSMGGIISTVLAAVEPDLSGIAICLAGADLARLVVTTSEERVHQWLDWRQATDGLGTDNLHWELDQHLDYEPARFAPFVATEKVLFVSASWDTVVPRRNQSMLWEALGRPKRLDVPFGHYSAAIALDRVLGAAAAHFRSHEPAPAESRGFSAGRSGAQAP